MSCDDGLDWKKFITSQFQSICTDDKLPFNELDPAYHKLISFKNESSKQEDLSEQELLTSIEGWFDSQLFSKKQILSACNLQHHHDQLNLRLIDHSEGENQEKLLQDMIYETVIIQYLNPLFQRLHQYVENNYSKEQMKNLLLGPLSRFLELSLDTSDSRLLFENIIDLHYSPNREDKLLAFLICIPWLETGMRDALFLYDCSTSIDKVKESLLNRLATFSDMLGSEDLIAIYGENAAFILKLCYGSQNTLNLRNVSMHGFISSHNFEPYHTSFLLFLMSHLGFIRTKYYESTLSHFNEKQKGKLLLRLQERKISSTLQEKDRHTLGLFEQSISVLEIPHEVSTVLSSVLPLELDFLQRMKSVVPLISKNEWKLVIESYVKYQQGTSQFNIYATLSRIFPIFEAFLRRLFVFCNIVSEDNYDLRFRMLQVERARSLVIFDTILSNNPNDYYNIEENKLFRELADNEIHCLYDLFKWPHGVKIRTFMAHGCIHWDWIPKHYLDRLMMLMIHLVHKYSQPQKSISNTVNTCSQFIESYSPCFHPQKLLKDDIFRACGHLQQVECLGESQDFCEMIQYFGPTEVAKNEAIVNKHMDEKLNTLIGNVKQCFFECRQINYEHKNSAVSSIIIHVLENFVRFDIEEISEKEFKLLLLARRMAQEISACLQYLSSSILSKWKKIRQLNVTQKTTLRSIVESLDRLRTACEFCLFIQVGVLQRSSNVSPFIAGCDRFLSQLTAALTKSQIAKCYEIMLAFTFTVDEIEQFGSEISLIHLKNKTLIKSLYHKQKL
ncbi:hypothetical protein C9374_005036 [Naegleria lovaniensis]|uniref:DUF4209 domain-containing protein n=1 Tax=Naegleria lovaniensis TaxID=51637 RepID=A0AA88GK57_NAELO|nr:uncharacterized protein C9374_005036 [Naegleria lovaniensis]KAG2382456.1 hypothetical protein C9374_005036 [Naegleria lovaniensis]